MKLASRLAFLYSLLVLFTMVFSGLAATYSLYDTMGEESYYQNTRFADALVSLIETHGEIPPEELQNLQLAYAVVVTPQGRRLEKTDPAAVPLKSSMVNLEVHGYKVMMATSDRRVRKEAWEAAGRQLMVGLPLAILVWIVGIRGLRKLLNPLERLERQTHGMASRLGDELEGEASPELLKLVEEEGETGGLAKSLIAIGSHLKGRKVAQEAMEAELRVGRELQFAMLPAPLPPSQQFEIATELRPAREMSGDLYHHFWVGEKLLLAVGDISGKGVSAAMMMAVAQTLINHCAREYATLAEAVAVINDRLSEDNPLAYFLTLFIGLYEPETGVLEYVNAGHPRPYVRDREGNVRELEGKGGMGLGVVAGKAFVSTTFNMERGETVVMFTDGVTEAQNSKGEMFAPQLAARIAEVSGGARETAERIVEAVDNFDAVELHQDDITVLVLKRC